MITSENILTENKERDCEIVNLFIEGLSCPLIKEALKLDISVRRIEQIIIQNKSIIKIEDNWEKTQLIIRIKKHIGNAKYTKKDVFDWESLLASLISPKKVEHSGEIKGQTIQVIIPIERQKEYDSRLSITPRI
jgi:NAD+--asparagine ADP-ribosyltransferase